MSKKLTIGVLLANSTILPMAANFNSGLKHGLNGLSLENDIEVEIVPEFIGQGSTAQVESAVNKLIGFNDSNIITGIISNSVSAELAEKFAKYKRPIIINNIGEHLPNPGASNDYVFLNSMHSWQQVWSIGKWAVQTFGKKGMLVSGLYDSGYSFPIMLRKGMEAATDDATLPFAIAPVRQYKGLADVTSVIPQLIEKNPDFVFATFCGEEATMFLSEYVKHGLHKRIPLLGLPFLLEAFDGGGESVDIYTTISAYRGISDADAEQLGRISLNPFRQFGIETGLVIKNAVKSSLNGSLQKALADTEVNDVRGKLDISSRTTGNNSKVFVIKNTYAGDKEEVATQLVGEVETIGIDSEVVEEINSQPSSGWFNPYLSI
ncbi:MAG TPA: ABC transporter substrate-binding protein [Mucilaginibacter sp.]